MEPKILYILPSYNIYGGTPKKTLDLMHGLKEKSVLYVYENEYTQFKGLFQETGGKVYEGFHGRNIIKHVRHLIRIIDENEIKIVQVQFTMGEILSFWIKLFRPKVKIIVAFVSAIQPSASKSMLVKAIYKRSDYFVFISNYVRQEKIRQFPLLAAKAGRIIYNGASKRKETGNCSVKMKEKAILAVSGLIELKNIQILIEAFHLLVNSQNRKDLSLYVVGDGELREELQQQISNYQLNSYVHLLGYKEDVGDLLKNCDVFVHPSFNEGFGIVVAEAMFSAKPIIVSDAGALPELISHEENGLVVDPHNAQGWAESILKCIDDRQFSGEIAANAYSKANSMFSLDRFINDYRQLYQELSI